MTDEVGKQSEENAIRDERGRFLPGNPGSPGRPKGSRHVLEEDFIAALQREFNRRGSAAVEDLDSKALCEMVTKVLPKESRVDVGETIADLVRRAADVSRGRT